MQSMFGSSDDVLVDGHDPGDGLPKDREVLASLRHVQMNSIREMPPHEASAKRLSSGMPFMASSSGLSRMSR